MTKPKKTPAEDDITAWMPLWIGSYLADTMKLSRDLHGGYLLLLMAYWRNRGPLPDNDEDLAGTVKASEDEWVERLRPKLAPFFHIEGGAWHHGRADEELAAALERRRKAVEKSAKATAGRYGPRHDQPPPTSPTPPPPAPSTASGMPQADHKQSFKDTSSPSPSPLSPDGDRSPPPPLGADGAPPEAPPPAPKQRKGRGKDPERYAEDFEVLWPLYPRRSGRNRALALAKYTARREEGTTPDELLQGVLRYAKHCRDNGTEDRYIKQAETFFGPMRHYLSDWSPIGAPAADSGPARATTKADRLRAAADAVERYGEDDGETDPHQTHSPDADGGDGVIDVEARRVA